MNGTAQGNLRAHGGGAGSADRCKRSCGHGISSFERGLYAGYPRDSVDAMDLHNGSPPAPMAPAAALLARLPETLLPPQKPWPEAA
jgi:hypothetical protein